MVRYLGARYTVLEIPDASITVATTRGRATRNVEGAGAPGRLGRARFRHRHARARAVTRTLVNWSEGDSLRFNRAEHVLDLCRRGAGVRRSL